MIPRFKEKLSLTLAWTKIITLGVVALYTLIFLIINRNATITPGLHLLFTKYESPNALLTLFIASTITVALSYLALSLSRAIHVLKAIKTEQRTRDIAAGLEKLKSNPSLSPQPVNIPATLHTPKPPTKDDGPIPLE